MCHKECVTSKYKLIVIDDCETESLVHSVVLENARGACLFEQKRVAS